MWQIGRLLEAAMAGVSRQHCPGLSSQPSTHQHPAQPASFQSRCFRHRYAIKSSLTITLCHLIQALSWFSIPFSRFWPCHPPFSHWFLSFLTSLLGLTPRLRFLTQGRRSGAGLPMYTVLLPQPILRLSAVQHLSYGDEFNFHCQHPPADVHLCNYLAGLWFCP